MSRPSSRRRVLAAAMGLVVLAGPGAIPASASAVTGGSTMIGTTSLPSGATMPTSACATSSTTEVLPDGTTSADDYVVPAGGGTITSWSFNTTGAKAGTPYTLLVVAPSGSAYQVVATDPETVPSGSAKVATFTLADPIPVTAGDEIGIVVSGHSDVGCLFKGGSIPSTDVEGFTLGPDAVGTVFTLDKTINYELVNVAATVVQSDDIAIAETAEPTAVTLGDDVTFLDQVTSAGPSNTAVTVTDTLPSGLRFVAASAGTGSCTTSGQTVRCTVSDAPASLAIVAQPKRTGSFANVVTAKGPLLDPQPSDNTARATVVVTR